MEDPALQKIKEQFEEVLTPENHNFIQTKKKVFDEICNDFSSDKAKAESKRERAEMGVLLQNNLTYGEIHFQSIAECFFFI